MSPDELDAFLSAERTCRVATVGADGTPHVVPLWFVWHEGALWLNSIVSSQRWADIQRRPTLGAVIDAGTEYFELRGVELTGRAEIVGEVPRTATPDARLTEPERLFGEKYANGAFVADGRHAWLRVDPDKTVSWDFRKL